MIEKSIFIENPEQTERLAEKIGEKLRGGECIELSSDLGGGKTTFTRGLVRGLGSFDAVSSPTFTISKQYKTSKLICYHFDFYRLQEPGLVKEELAEAICDPYGVIVVEWANSVSEVLPDNKLVITFDRQPDNSEHRKITLKCNEDLSYLFEGVV